MDKRKPIVYRLAAKLYRVGRIYHESCRASRHLTDMPVVIACVSGPRRRGQSIPPGDILLHVGSLSENGTFDEIQEQIKWLNCSGPQQIFCIGGSKDLLLDKKFTPTKTRNTADELRWSDVVRLKDSMGSINPPGAVMIYGSAASPGTGAFQYVPVTDEECRRLERSHRNSMAKKDDTLVDPWFNRLPPFPATDILMTNVAPACHPDDAEGCASLLRMVWGGRPQIIICAGSPSARPISVLYFDAMQRHYEDALLSTRQIYAWISLLLLFWHVLVAAAKVWFGVREKLEPSSLAWYHGQSTTVINLGGVGERGVGRGDSCLIFLDRFARHAVVYVDPQMSNLGQSDLGGNLRIVGKAE